MFVQVFWASVWKVTKKVPTSLAHMYEAVPLWTKVSVELKTGSPHKNLTSARDWGEGSTSHPSHFTLWERTPSTQWIVGTIGHWTHLNILEKWIKT